LLEFSGKRLSGNEERSDWEGGEEGKKKGGGNVGNKGVCKACIPREPLPVNCQQPCGLRGSPQDGNCGNRGGRKMFGGGLNDRTRRRKYSDLAGVTQESSMCKKKVLENKVCWEHVLAGIPSSSLCHRSTIPKPGEKEGEGKKAAARAVLSRNSGSILLKFYIAREWPDGAERGGENIFE